MRDVYYTVTCLVAALHCITRCAALSAQTSCDTSAPSQWHLTSTREQHQHVFVRNVVKRACALRSGKLKRPGWRISIQGASSWEETALVLTAAATDAYIHDHALHLSGDLPAAVSSSGGGCDMSTGCLFGNTPASVDVASDEHTHSTEQQHDAWGSQRVLTHYLRGAGLLWLRGRTSDVTGCHLAGAFAMLHLQPDGTFRELVDSIAGKMTNSKYDQVVVVNVDSKHTTMDTVLAALNKEKGPSTGACCLVRGGTRYVPLLSTYVKLTLPATYLRSMYSRISVCCRPVTNAFMHLW